MSSLRPWIEDYAKDAENILKVSPVLEIKRTRKNTGYLVSTEEYSLMLFHNQRILNHLLEALKLWCKEGQGYLIVCQVVESSPYYKLGVDSSSPAQYLEVNEGKYLLQQGTGYSLEEQQDNPFLPQPGKARVKKPRLSIPI